MSKYRSYARQGSFDPLQVPDASQKIDAETKRRLDYMRDAQQITQDNQRVVRTSMERQASADSAALQQEFQANMANMAAERDQAMQTYELENARMEAENARTADTMRMIGELSSSAMKAYQTFDATQTENRKEAYSTFVNQFGVTVAEQAAVNKIDFSMSMADLQNQSIVQELMGRGASIDELRRAQQLGGAKKYTDRKGLILNTLSGMDTALLELESKDYQITLSDGTEVVTNYTQASGPSGSPEARQRVIQQMRTDYWQTSGLAAENPQLANTLAQPKLNQYFQRLNTAYATEERKRLSAEAANNTFQVYNNRYRDGRSLDTTFQLVEGASGRQRSINRGDFFTWAEAAVETGQLDPGELQNFIEQKQVCINGDCQSIIQRYGADPNVTGALEAAITKQKSNRTAADQKLTVAKKEATALARNYRAAIYQSGQVLTPAEKELLIQKFNENTDYMYPDVADTMFDDIPTTQTKETEDAMAEMKRLYESFNLTPEAVRATADQEVMDAYLAKAEKQQKLRDAEGYDAKIYEDRFEDLVQSPNAVFNSRGITGGKFDPTVDQKKYELINQFNRRVAQLTVDPSVTAEQAAAQAFAEIESAFRAKYLANDSASLFEGGAYKEIATANRTAAGNAEQFNAKITSVNDLLRDNADNLNNLLDQQVFMNDTELEAAIEGYGQPGWSPPPITEYISKALSGRVSPFEVLQRQLESSATLEPLENPGSIDTAASTIRPEFLELIQQFPTPERSNRGMSTIGSFEESLVPNGYGPLIQEASSRYGANPTAIAALMEIESGFDRGAVSRTGAVGLMQIQPDAHPLYKGGNDPAANIDYGTQYYQQLVEQFKDPVLAAGAYNAGPGRMLEHIEQGRPLPAETVQHMRKFSIALAKYGDQAQLNSTRTMRSSMAAHLQPLSAYAPQVSSIVMERSAAEGGQPGMDIFFEDHQFPAVLPGVVKDSGYQVNSDGSGYGYYAVISSIDPTTGQEVDVLYGHFPEAFGLPIGSQVQAGQVIGRQGGTGSVQSYDGTIASIDFLAPAPKGSTSMVPYANYQQLRERIAQQLRN